jgi:hypothetical protein
MERSRRQVDGHLIRCARERANPKFQDLDSLKTEAIEPGKTRHLEFIRPVEVSTGNVTAGVAETHTCQPSTLRDFSVIFEDGTAFGARELVDQQFVNWREVERSLGNPIKTSITVLEKNNLM